MAKLSWTCDKCGESIDDVEHGWVEWISCKDTNGNWKGRNLRLVHHQPFSPIKSGNGCQYNQRVDLTNEEILSDLPLRSFVGADGLMDLLALTADQIPTDEVVEMVKRLHIPNYEAARLHFHRAIAGGAFEPNTRPGFYSQSDIAAVLKFVRQNPE
ncbi:MAG: hypothetical protein ABI042_09200 [Verrucomicrobiota bacterium]